MISFLLTFLPIAVIHLVVVLGAIIYGASYAVSIISRFVPWASATILRLIGAFVLICGVWLEGGAAYKQHIDTEIAVLKERIRNAEIKSNDLNEKLEKELEKDKTIIREQAAPIVRYLRSEGTKYDKQCVVAKEIIEAHNSATEIGESTQDDSPEKPKKIGKMILPPRMPE